MSPLAVAAAVAAVAAAVVAAGSTVVVPAGSGGIVLRLGRYARTLEEGRHRLVPLLEAVVRIEPLGPRAVPFSAAAEPGGTALRGALVVRIADLRLAHEGVHDLEAFVAGVAAVAAKGACGGRSRLEVREHRRELEAEIVRRAGEAAAPVGMSRCRASSRPRRVDVARPRRRFGDARPTA